MALRSSPSTFGSPGSSGEFVLDILGFDAKGSSCYHARRSDTIKAGNNDDLAQPEFEYAGPDAKVTTIHVAPGPMTLDAGATTTLSVNGTDASNILVSAIRVGWTSRDPAIATVTTAAQSRRNW